MRRHDSNEFVNRLTDSLKKMMPRITPEHTERIISIFAKTLTDSLKDDPDVFIKGLGWFCLTSLADRKRVLRGKTYQTKTHYKTRFYMSKEMLEEISKTYDMFKEDLE